jgi:peptidoglycan/xylan/chitin deacetylase (PgdA/CDA1 family)
MSRLRRIAALGTPLALAVALGTVPAVAAPSAKGHEGVNTGRPASMCPPPRPGAQYDGPAVRGGRRTIALTFDDGPGGSTQAIINILQRYHVRATFFNVGTGEGEWPSLVREEVKDGFLLGDHTVDHRDLAQLSRSAQGAEIDGVVNEQRALAKSSPCVFRPPYGAFNATTVSLVNARRMTLWMWNNSGADWMARGSGSSYWVNRIVSLAEGEGVNQRHAVVLLHNQPIHMPATVAALPRIIEFFQRRGYAFVDLLGRSGPPGSCASAPTVTPRVPGTALRPATGLASGGAISSPGGQYTLRMQSDGDLALRLKTGRLVWSTRTAGHPGARLAVDAAGKVTVRTSDDQVVWSAGTAGHHDAHVVVRADGNFAVAQGGTTIWTSKSTVSTLLPGERLRTSWRLTSPNGLCRLVQLHGGSLDLLGADGQVLWRTGSDHAAGASTVLLRAGNLGVFDRARHPRWLSATNGYRKVRVTLTNHGTLVITSGRATVWTTE